MKALFQFIPFAAPAFLALSASSTAAPAPSAIHETFAENPLEHGWRLHGDANLVTWDSEREQIEFQWDSSKPNTYFYYPLPSPVTEADDFSFSMDLTPDSIVGGADPEKPSSFQLAFGMIRLADAVSPGFLRGTGVGARHVVEFDYFPDTGFGATISPTMISGTTQFATTFNFPIEITAGDRFSVTMEYQSSTERLDVSILRNGEPFESIESVQLTEEFSGFSVNAFSISSYSDDGQSPPEFAGSILASAAIDDILIRVPEGPLALLPPNVRLEERTLEFHARAGSTYVLQRSDDLASWVDIAEQRSERDGIMGLKDPEAENHPASFYRVRLAFSGEMDP